MELLQMLSHAGLVSLLSLVIGVLPIGIGAAYAIRPTEQQLALMRPFSLASIFGGLSGSMAGFMNVLSLVWSTDGPADTRVMAVGAAESLVPMFVAFGSLTIAWLCAAIGLKRQA